MALSGWSSASWSSMSSADRVKAGMSAKSKKCSFAGKARPVREAILVGHMLVVARDNPHYSSERQHGAVVVQAVGQTIEIFYQGLPKASPCFLLHSAWPLGETCSLRCRTGAPRGSGSSLTQWNRAPHGSRRRQRVAAELFLLGRIHGHGSSLRPLCKALCT